MITGTLMLDVDVSCKNEQELNDTIAWLLKQIKGNNVCVVGAEVVDQDINEEPE